MTAFIIRRLIQAAVVIFIVSIVVFLAMRLLPGDPLLIYMGQRDLNMSTTEQVELLKKKFGLDKPMIVQYIDWITGFFRLDLGRSIHFDTEVITVLKERMPITIHLGILAFIVSGILGLSAGVVAALRRGKAIDTIITVIANFGITVPIFWLAILMIYGFGLKLNWLPVHGYTSPAEDFWLSSKQVIMPVICLAIFSISSIARQTRSSMLEVIRQDYIRTAWAKGLREGIIVSRHALKNGLIPVVTLIGLQVRSIFGGQVLIEKVFNIPGIGRMLVNSVFDQDFAIVQSGVLIISLIVVITNLIVDISYGWLDPRIRYS